MALGHWLCFVIQFVSSAAAAAHERSVQLCSVFKCSSSGVQLVLLGNSCLRNEQQVVDEPMAVALRTLCSSSVGWFSP